MEIIMEVTEKEAHVIYSDRYLDEKGSGKFLLLKIVPILVMALGVSFWISIATIYEWLVYVVGAILATPALYLWLRLLHRSGKYAKKQIEEIKC